MSTPIAITASKGRLGIETFVGCEGAGVPERDGDLLSEGDDMPKFRPRRSPALEPVWT